MKMNLNLVGVSHHNFVIWLVEDKIISSYFNLRCLIVLLEIMNIEAIVLITSTAY